MRAVGRPFQVGGLCGNPSLKRTRSPRRGLLARLFSGIGGGDGFPNLYGWGPTLPGAAFDYRSEAGPLWENSIVAAGIGWIANTLPEAILGVRRFAQADAPSNPIDPRHPAATLISHPNPAYDGTVLWAGSVLGLIVDGNAYWRKVRSAAGKVTQLWYIPHWRIEPTWPSDGSAFVSGYRLRVDGRNVDLDIDDVVHLRHHIPDPYNERKGLSPLRAALREVCTDNEAATYTAALMRNSGAPGVLISPDGAGAEGRDLVFEKKQRDDLLALWRSKFTGDHRGEPFVAPIPMKVQPFTFNPQQMLADKVGDRSEERLCALMGLPPVVLGLGVGLRNAANRSNVEESRRAAYESLIVPLQQRLANQLTAQLLPDFEPAASQAHFAWDRSRIDALRESEDARFSRVCQAYQAGLMDREEGRKLLGL